MKHIQAILEDLNKFEMTHIINGTMMASVDGKIIYSKSFGMADFEANIPCSSDTQYNIASVTKQFTAVAILKLLYDDNQSLDYLHKALQTPLSKYLSQNDYIWDGVMPDWANVVTIHQLLTHTSGIVNYTDMDTFWEQLYLLDRPQMVDLVRLFKEQDLRFESGTQYEYCNSGFTLLGQVIERLSKKTLSNYFKETFFIPLGMGNTALPTQGTSLSLRKSRAFSQLARGYTYTLSNAYGPYTELKHYWPHTINLGDGGLISTAPDLIKWSEALYKGHVLPKEILNLMLTPYEAIPGEPDAFYGYGIVSRNTRLGNIFTHGGNVPGYNVYPIHIPVGNITIVSFSNLSFDSTSMKSSEEKDQPEVAELREKHTLLSIKDLENLIPSDGETTNRLQ